jgi:hypothetical protein
MTENSEKSGEVVPISVKESGDEKNNKTNTLKNVKRKIRKNLTFRRGEKPKVIVDESADKNDKSGDESVEKEKFTLKKIFRKSSFRKIISNIQQFTNFTVSILSLSLPRPFISFHSDTIA